MAISSVEKRNPCLGLHHQNCSMMTMMMNCLICGDNHDTIVHVDDDDYCSPDFPMVTKQVRVLDHHYHDSHHSMMRTVSGDD